MSETLRKQNTTDQKARISRNDTIPGDSSLSSWKERQSAGRAGPPIPRHCAPESGPIRRSIVSRRQFDAHTPGCDGTLSLQ
ncbi:hypothetical protein K0M31_019677 [Melipona bicolor]|uniref:Uncharacterized protein n=1 Tax=Melipona bicolor TaxID=60889 RepID=A0AA40KRE5_9HYME|nr:hypothetical protein K0M31_019677 [Melipona bicolor]